MTALARWCFRHRFTVITIWIAALVAVAVPYLMLGAGYNDAFNLPGMESTKAQSLVQAHTPAQAGDTDQIVIHTTHGSVQDPAVEHRVAAMLTDVAALPSVVSVDSIYTAAGAGRISHDRTTAYATVTFDAQGDQVPVADTNRVIHTAKAAAGAGVRVELGGVAVTDATGTSAPSTEYIGILAAGVILFVAFGTLLGMIVPLLVAIAGVGTGMVTIGMLSRVTTIGTIAPSPP
jgi:RND superfamily putative drug exporter